MDDVAPVEIDRFLIGDAEELDIGAVDEAALAIELRHPDRHRRRIGDQAEPLLTLAQPPLGVRVAADRYDRTEQADDPAVLTEDRIVGISEPDRLAFAVAGKVARLGFEIECLAGHRALGIRFDPVPRIRPDLARRTAERRIAIAEQVAIGVVEHHQQIGAPGEEHRKRRAEHHRCGGFQRLRPGFGRP